MENYKDAKGIELNIDSLGRKLQRTERILELESEIKAGNEDKLVEYWTEVTKLVGVGF